DPRAPSCLVSGPPKTLNLPALPALRTLPPRSDPRYTSRLARTRRRTAPERILSRTEPPAEDKVKANGARAHPVHRQARRREGQSHRRGLSSLRASRPLDRRRADAPPVAARSRGLLRRAPRAPVLQGPGALHDVGPDPRAGAGGRGRGRAQPRHHGRDRSEEGGPRHDPRRPRRQHRGEHCARLGCARDRRTRDRLLLQRHGAAPARLRSALTPMPAAAITDPAAAAERTNLLGLARPDLEAFIEQLGGKPFRARQLMNWIYKRGVDRSEEHTSELQSPYDLVCRLLLEKKNIKRC